MRQAADISLLDHKFTIVMLEVDKSLDLFQRLAKDLGPGFKAIATGAASFLGGGNHGADLLSMDLSAAVGSIAELFARLPADELQQIRRLLLTGATIDGKELTIDLVNAVFTGRILSLFKLLVFAIQTNYGDFFDAGRGLQSRRAAAVGSAT